MNLDDVHGDDAALVGGQRRLLPPVGIYQQVRPMDLERGPAAVAHGRHHVASGYVLLDTTTPTVVGETGAIVGHERLRWKLVEIRDGRRIVDAPHHPYLDDDDQAVHLSEGVLDIAPGRVVLLEAEDDISDFTVPIQEVFGPLDGDRFFPFG